METPHQTPIEVKEEPMAADIDNGAPAEWKKYSEYSITVDPDQDDKATEIKLT
eukprot:CAMPEP_0172439000 /NCGR_PEP_ID=MMETSP1065-20121228/119_1 /TAXON_ID=265537 /ORGANISM="Amphiprora paludosa, Strain CCMP125" /LENGTH=52 /DNA_ID=CAMNT_0013187617 /DNA_START=134 /DNA_END=288 /DNA_ORIENTATION=-